MIDKKALEATIEMLRERAPDIDWDLFAKVMAETPQSVRQSVRRSWRDSGPSLATSRT